MKNPNEIAAKIVDANIGYAGSAHLISDFAAAIQSERDELGKLKAEDEKIFQAFGNVVANHIKRERVLREALKPFVRYASKFDDKLPGEIVMLPIVLSNGCEVGERMTVSDFRVARAALDQVKDS